MKVDIKDTGANEKQLNLVLEKADFAPELNAKLKEARSKASLKGFRQGKTPMGMIKRMHGRQFALEVISQKVNEKLNEIVTENKFEMINEPLIMNSSIPAMEGGDLEADCTFSYTLGMMPEIDLSGVSTDTSYKYYELEADADEVKSRFDGLRKQLGQQVNPDTVGDADNVEVEAVELDGTEVKEGGHTTTFKFAVDLVEDKKLKEELIGLGNGDSFDFNIYKLEGDRNQEYVQKYLMKIEDDSVDVETIGEDFRATISSIQRQEPAELDEDFFKKGFPEGVNSEEDAISEINKQYVKSYESVGNNLLIKEVIAQVEEKNNFELPETYIHQLLHANGNHAHDDHDHDDELENLRQSVRRQVIVSMMIKKFGIEITQDDMRSKVMEEFSSNFGNMTLPPETIDKIVTNAMNDEKYVRELSDRVLNDKLIEAVKSNVKLDIVKKHKDALMEIYEEAFPKNEPAEEG